MSFLIQLQLLAGIPTFSLPKYIVVQGITRNEIATEAHIFTERVFMASHMLTRCLVDLSVALTILIFLLTFQFHPENYFDS